ncbi:Coiled-coil domain-containing protein 93 [Quillaja saponaria]|uniref:Coiled-coil domain-containing protein 93 n=1 Tax=Quillaja saponaria TaxID=32244 RepID=A0AAD7PK84_QUISA|nr:Coiled-coil domain-containing protein 93 [Quillaja saponaria]
MADSQCPIQEIFDLLSSAGYVDATKSDASSAEKIAGGLAWCIASVESSDLQSDVVSDQTVTPKSIIDNALIEERLRLLGCPYILHETDIQNLDNEVLFPVIQWLVKRVRKQRGNGDNEDGQLKEPETSTVMIGNLDELNQRKDTVLNELHCIREGINKEGSTAKVQKLISLLELLKDIERQESDLRSDYDAKHSELQAEIIELEAKIASGCDSKDFSNQLNHSLSESHEKLNSAKKELAARLRAVVAVKRKLDDLPCPSELIQYESRFSELYAYIQGKHRQTRKFYTTFNALLEIKELMLKETSLLNSIISQFQDAFSSSVSRIKLIDSMEGIVKGSQQKQEKVQVRLRARRESS